MGIQVDKHLSWILGWILYWLLKNEDGQRRKLESLLFMSTLLMVWENFQKFVTALGLKISTKKYRVS